jgi:class 3 adenylate cyclase/tetratricopeptide (TPR) repeat protein
MDFYDLLDQVMHLLRRRGRVTYGALKRQFHLEDEVLADLKDEIIKAQQLAIDENDEVMVWTGGLEASPASPTFAPFKPAATAGPPTAQERDPLSYTPKHLAEKILQSKAALEGERKQVTVLFCDLAKSMTIAERIGPENMHTLLNRFFALSLDEVHRYEGTINQFLGDGFMALFGAPIAHEDHARRGVLAALALQHTLKEADCGKSYSVPCTFRMGLDSGFVVVGSIGDNLRMDYSAIGDTTNLAFRLQQQCEPGEILVSASTCRLVQDYVRLEALQPVDVKGKAALVQPYKVLGVRPRRSPIVSRGERTPSRFVGRERELAVLDELLKQAESGQGQVVGIVAEAGGGKSRLVYEFRQRLDEQRVTYLEGHSLSYGSGIPYHSIRDLVRHHCDIIETDSPEAISEKVRGTLQDVGMDAEVSAPYLLQLLGIKEGTESLAMLTPEAIKTRTFDTLKQMSLKASQQHPLICEIEDLHWLDRTSEDYLASLVESLAGASILLLTTYRPGYRPPWIDKSYATQIPLHSLTPQDALTIVHSTSQQTALSERLARAIVEKAEGNPFFLEELTRAVLERADSETDIDVPDTIQGVLMARIDRLPEGPKRLLQTASVLGREFSPRLLATIWEGSESLEPLLVELKRLEFHYERSGAEEPVYVFKHALMQEVAYESLLTPRRRHLHAATGQALESLYAGHLEDVYDHLAYHYARTTEEAKAVDYLTRFADKAARAHAHAEAVTALQEALAHAERFSTIDRDQRCIELVLHLAPSLYFLGRFAETRELLEQHRERLESLQEPRLAGPYYFWLGHSYDRLGHHQQTVQNVQQALEEATRCGDNATMGKTYYLLAMGAFRAGQFPQGIAHGRQAIALLDGTEERWWLGQTHWVMGLNYGSMGDFAQALEAEKRTQAIGEVIGDLRLQNYAACFSGWWLALRGDGEAAIEAAQRCLHNVPDPLTTANACIALGLAYIAKGDATQAITPLEQAVQHYVQFRHRHGQALAMILLSEAWLIQGDLERARDLAQRGLTMARDIMIWDEIGKALGVLGRVAQESGNFLAAEGYLRESLQTFVSIQAKFELARTHLALAALAHAQGNQTTTPDHLSKAYAWFIKLQVPKWAERTAQLSREYGATLQEVALEELTEDPS